MCFQIFDMMDAKARDKCLREVKLLQSVNHPNIIRYIDSFLENNDLVILLEFAQGGDLKKYAIDITTHTYFRRDNRSLLSCLLQPDPSHQAGVSSVQRGADMDICRADGCWLTTHAPKAYYAQVSSPVCPMPCAC